MSYTPTDTELAEHAILNDVTIAHLSTKWKEHVLYLQGLNIAPAEFHFRDIAQRLNPHSAGKVVREHALPALRRAAGIEWAAAVGEPASRVLRWIDENTVTNYGVTDVNMGDLVRAFPIELPRNDDGLINLNLLTDTYNDRMNRALILDQLCEVSTTCAEGGGDDTWFDYLPDAIRVLALLQDEFWSTSLTFILNNEQLFHADWPEDREGEWEDAKTRNECDVFLMDYTSNMIFALADEHAEDDLTIRVIPPRV